jgi:diguanylate cyclase (GGDEF)-like protein/PAS domain S-box-containing protein
MSVGLELDQDTGNEPAERSIAITSIFNAQQFTGNSRPMWVYECALLRIVEVNPAAVAHYGYSRPDFLAMTLRDLHPESEWDALELNLQTASHDALSYSPGWTHRKADGSFIRVDITSLPVERDGTSCRLVLATDVTARHEEQLALMYLAHRDELTGLPRRAHLATILEHSVHGSRCRGTLVGVAFIDLNDFKGINDTFGHAAGDDVLVSVSQRLSSHIRAQDTVARLGGDEFVVIFADLRSRDHLVQLVARLLNAFADPFVVVGSRMTLKGSIGVSLSPGDGTTPEALLRSADDAMYHAKVERLGVHFASDRDGYPTP